MDPNAGRAPPAAVGSLVAFTSSPGENALGNAATPEEANSMFATWAAPDHVGVTLVGRIRNQWLVTELR
jgi:hypothetical protein